MSRILVVMFVLLVLVACRGRQSAPDVDPVLVTPEASNVGVNSPRVEATATSSLPPTWTPIPATPGGHLPETGSEPAPGAVAAPVAGTRTVYIVQRGDTLGEIAKRYNVPLASLARVNNIQNWDLIEVGMTLVIPAE